MLSPMTQYPRWQYRHEGLLIALVERPELTQRAIARLVGYSEWHVSRIVNSPDFQAQFHRLIEARHQVSLKAWYDRFKAVSEDK